MTDPGATLADRMDAKRRPPGRASRINGSNIVRALFALLFILFCGYLFFFGIGFFATLGDTKAFITRGGGCGDCLPYSSFGSYVWTGTVQFALGLLCLVAASIVGLIKQRSGAGIMLILAYVLLTVLYQIYSAC
jgi:hypothetical protein